MKKLSIISIVLCFLLVSVAADTCAQTKLTPVQKQTQITKTVLKPVAPVTVPAKIVPVKPIPLPIPVPKPEWVEMKGLLKAIKYIPLPQPMENANDSTVVPLFPQRAHLLDENGNIIAYLFSTTIPLVKYDGLLVLAGGYKVKNVILQSSITAIKPSSLIPTIDVRKITVINPPPVIETWKGIAYPNITPSSTPSDPPFVFKTPCGKIIGYLTTDNNVMMALLRAHTIHFLIAVTGPVTTISSSTDPVKIKIMKVDKMRVLDDLRHIIWMSTKPLVVKVGDEVNFNEIGGIKVPLVDAGSATDDTADLSPDTSVVLQRYWDFDTKIRPIPIPIPGIPPVEVDNAEAIPVELDNAEAVEVLKCVPVEFITYDYLDDSRIVSILPHNPIFVYATPGMYKITLTGAYADANGFVRKMESASRLLKVVPQDTTPVEPPENEGDNDGTVVTP